MIVACDQHIDMTGISPVRWSVLWQQSREIVMIIVLEIAFFFGGLYAIITGKIPGFLIGGPRFEVIGTPARQLGVPMMLPLPASFAVSFLMARLYGTQGIGYAATFEFGFTVLIAVIVWIAIRNLRKPKMTMNAEGVMVEAVSNIEDDIIRQLNSAWFYAIVGIIFAGFILGPLAFWRASQVIKLIEQHHVLENKLSGARFVRVMGIVVGGLWLLSCGWFLWFMLTYSG
jgi:hypothetical protein